VPMARDRQPNRAVLARQEQQRHIARLNRIYAVLSGINSTIVRVREREELLREACRIVVRAGGFRLAWVGLVDAKANRVKPWPGTESARTTSE